MATRLACVSKGQKIFTYAGYYGNWFAREAVRSIERLSRPMPQDNGHWWAEIGERVKKTVSAVFSVPFAAVLAIPTFAFYGLAAISGEGRFEIIETEGRPLAERSIKIVSLNACFQDPWSPLTGGVEVPLKLTQRNESRVAATVNKVAKENPQIFLGQEFESLGAQDEAIRLFRGQGFCNFIRDLGSNDPVRNNSGLFVASKVPLQDVQFTTYPSEDREGLAKWSNQGALSFRVRVGDADIRLVNVHLNYGEGPVNQAARERQLTKHVAPLLDQPAVLFGDLNFDTSLQGEIPGLPGFVNALAGRVTCSDEGKHTLRGKPREGCSDCRERIDGVIYRQERMNVHVGLRQWPKLSDHFAVVAQVQAI